MNLRAVWISLALLTLYSQINYATETEEESVEASHEMQNAEEPTYSEGTTQRYQEVKQHYDEVMIKYNEIMNTYEDLNRRYRTLQMHDKGAADYPELKQQYEEELNHYHNVSKKEYDEALNQYHEAKQLYDEEVGQHNQTEGEHESEQEIPVAREAPRDILDGHEAMIEHEYGKQQKITEEPEIE